MREYSIQLGGADRRLRFNSFDGRALYKRFRDQYGSLSALCWQGVLGAEADGSIGIKFDPEAQIALLTAGLIRGGTRCNEEMVTQWFDEHLAADKPSGELLWPAVKAFFYSGAVTGRQTDIEEVAAEVGKGPGTMAGSVVEVVPETKTPLAVKAVDSV